MPYYPKEKYTLVNFKRSHLKNKKYDAILKNKETNRNVKVPFGARGYEQYKDKTPLQFYKKYNHGDKTRRANYRARHAKNINKPFSPSWFSLKYLW